MLAGKKGRLSGRGSEAGRGAKRYCQVLFRTSHILITTLFLPYGVSFLLVGAPSSRRSTLRDSSNHGRASFESCCAILVTGLFFRKHIGANLLSGRITCVFPFRDASFPRFAAGIGHQLPVSCPRFTVRCDEMPYLGVFLA